MLEISSTGTGTAADIPVEGFDKESDGKMIQFKL